MSISQALSLKQLMAARRRGGGAPDCYYKGLNTCSLLYEGLMSLVFRVCVTEPGDVIGCYLCLPEPVAWPADPREDSKLYEYLQGDPKAYYIRHRGSSQ